MNINQHDLSDDELDHLFRDSAEKTDFDFDPDSWTKMSQKLDAVDLPASGENQTKNVWLKRGLPILLALLFLIGGYYLFTPSSKQATTSPTKQKNSSENESKVDAKKHVTTDKVDTGNLKNDVLEQKSDSKTDINNSKPSTYENKKAERKIKIATKLEKEEEALFNKKAENASKFQENGIVKNSAKLSAKQAFVENSQTSKKNIVPVDKQNDDLVNKTIAETNVTTQERITNNISGKTKKEGKNSKENSGINTNQAPINKDIISPTSINQEIEKLSESNSIAIITEEKAERWQLEGIKSLTPKGVFFKSNFNLPLIVFESPKTELPIPTSKSTSFKRGLNLRLAVSPDFSLITTDKIARLGTNWAALLEYRFNNRLSLHTGVIRSMKYYNAYPESYAWPYSWPDPPVLIDINATCKMLDIPLNLRYDITQKPNSRLFVSAGATSYVMLNEKYTYNYENQWDPKIKWRNWEGKTGSYYLSVLNFSFGYEHQVFRRLSLQAEPFLKVPIGKVGFGKVNLSTIGIFVSAKYPIARF